MVVARGYHGSIGAGHGCCGIKEQVCKQSGLVHRIVCPAPHKGICRASQSHATCLDVYTDTVQLLSSLPTQLSIPHSQAQLLFFSDATVCWTDGTGYTPAARRSMPSSAGTNSTRWTIKTSTDRRRAGDGPRLLVAGHGRAQDTTEKLGEQLACTARLDAGLLGQGQPYAFLLCNAAQLTLEA